MYHDHYDVCVHKKIHYVFETEDIHRRFFDSLRGYTVVVGYINTFLYVCNSADITCTIIRNYYFNERTLHGKMVIYRHTEK